MGVSLMCMGHLFQNLQSLLPFHWDPVKQKLKQRSLLVYLTAGVWYPVHIKDYSEDVPQDIW